MTATTLGGSSNGVHVFIPAALNRPTHTLYSICMMVQPTAQEWTVNRRYSQFLQLKKDILQELINKRRKNSTNCMSCPSCSSFERAILAFAFPQKAWLRTNKVVRKRVTSLQLFLQLLVERIFNNVPKCFICGDRMKQIVRPFLLRGAQPIGGSTIAIIQQSLQLQSYAIINRPPRKYCEEEEEEDSYYNNSNEQEQEEEEEEIYYKTTNRGSLTSKKQEAGMIHMMDTSMASTSRDDSSDPLVEVNSPTDICQNNSSSSNNSSTKKTKNKKRTNNQQEALEDEEEVYGYGSTERCHDPAIPLEEAIKDVVLPEGVAATYEESVFRLSTMWDAFADMETTPFPPYEDSISKKNK